MIKRNSVLKILEDNQSKIKQLGVKRIGIFGSFSTQRQTKRSDVDVLVEFHKGQKSFDHFMDLKELLEKLLKRKVDLVTKEAVKSEIKSTIFKETQYAGI